MVRCLSTSPVVFFCASSGRFSFRGCLQLKSQSRPSASRHRATDRSSAIVQTTWRSRVFHETVENAGTLYVALPGPRSNKAGSLTAAMCAFVTQIFAPLSKSLSVLRSTSIRMLKMSEPAADSLTPLLPISESSQRPSKNLAISSGVPSVRTPLRDCRVAEKRRSLRRRARSARTRKLRAAISTSSCWLALARRSARQPSQKWPDRTEGPSTAGPLATWDVGIKFHFLRFADPAEPVRH